MEKGKFFEGGQNRKLHPFQQVENVQQFVSLEPGIKI
jgi:hypothetical protein